MFISVSVLLSVFVDLEQIHAKDFCRKECTRQDKPVCGSDGKKYESHCHLKKFNCLNQGNITLHYHGDCDCPSSCNKDYKPHCASDGKTFLNICQFKKEQCKLKKHGKELLLQKKGPCRPWVNKKCPAGCSDIWAPVCGTNGKTYSSICSVKLARCQTSPEKRSTIGLSKIGLCKKGQCPEYCPDKYRPTCASNGVLYASECEMRLAACRMDKLYEIKRSSKKSLCRGKCVTDCPQTKHEVCGSDSITYANECEMYRENCKRKKTVTLIKKEPCDVGASLLPIIVQNVIGAVPVV